ncbi:hypothetical protein MLD38_037403 [Melastoma candidum]|uniref:Uncharacterized protein n=1 Tax=Melastoma candidum TaxID=119954 RepID=A0ACB9LN67_9MYRT|nr:hypothetical protein MLD38_037403 [Melastoma candidum]
MPSSWIDEVLLPMKIFGPQPPASAPSPMKKPKTKLTAVLAPPADQQPLLAPVVSHRLNRSNSSECTPLPVLPRSGGDVSMFHPASPPAATSSDPTAATPPSPPTSPATYLCHHRPVQHQVLKERQRHRRRSDLIPVIGESAFRTHAPSSGRETQNPRPSGVLGSGGFKSQRIPALRVASAFGSISSQILSPMPNEDQLISRRRNWGCLFSPRKEVF